jgi:hypothetical protein
MYNGKSARSNGVASQKKVGFGNGVNFQEALILYCVPK